MTMDGKIATAFGESKWITGQAARAYAMHLRQGADVILVGINTVLADDPSLTVRKVQSPPVLRSSTAEGGKSKIQSRTLRRIILDSQARTPLAAKVLADEHAALTTIVVSELALKSR